MSERSSDSTTFIPRYEFRQRFALIAAPFMLALAVWAAVSGGREEPMLYVAAAFFALAAVVIPFRFVRRIRFGSCIHVDRYLLPSIRIEYSEIQDIGVTTVKTRRANISMFGMRNASELLALLGDARTRGEISEGQIEGSLAARETLAWTASSYAILPSIVVTALLLWLSPVRIAMDGRLSFLVYWTPTFLASYFIAKWLLTRLRIEESNE
jgi:hypothetical protein